MKRKKYVIPVHERAADAEEDGSVQALPVLRLGRAHRRAAKSATTRASAKEGTFAEAVAAIAEAKRRGFTVTTNTTFFNTDTPQTVIDVLNFLNDEAGVDKMMISPAYAYERAPDQEHFLGVQETRELFHKAFADGRRKKWRLNHSPLFLDFLEGKVDFDCTAWGIPSYSLFGWQRPCYLMSDGYVATYKELIETTDWSSSTAAAATRAARTAWRTAATSRRRCWRRCARSSSRCGRPREGETQRGRRTRHWGVGGIGRASCERLAAAGAKVIASGTKVDNLSGLPGTHLAADLADPEGVQRLAADALAAHGRVDLVIHCAGVGLAGAFAGAGSGRIGELVEVNVRAPMLLTALLLPPMLERRSGAVVAVASIAGAVGVPGETAYSASKAAVRGFCEALRAEVRPSWSHGFVRAPRGGRHRLLRPPGRCPTTGRGPRRFRRTGSPTPSSGPPSGEPRRCSSRAGSRWPRGCRAGSPACTGCWPADSDDGHAVRSRSDTHPDRPLPRPRTQAAVPPVADTVASPV